jgi:hypothetical protein
MHSAFARSAHTFTPQKTDKARTALAYAMNEDFSRVLAKQMDYYSQNGGQDKVDRVKAEMDDVKNVMVDNIEKVISTHTHTHNHMHAYMHTYVSTYVCIVIIFVYREAQTNTRTIYVCVCVCWCIICDGRRGLLCDNKESATLAQQQRRQQGELPSPCCATTTTVPLSHNNTMLFTTQNSLSG